ncbi:MAG TPA: VWA domain-containing protein [Kiloniellaceae bacterium]|nr:VWA domain-containing protein [Kiloniellaceae bacterium]
MGRDAESAGAFDARELSPVAGAQLRLRVAAFLALLRENGFLIGLEETQDCLRFAGRADLARPAVLRGGLRAIACTRQEDWRRFDELFDAYWLKRGIKGLLRVTGTPPKGRGQRNLSEAGAPGGSLAAPQRSERGDEAGLGNPADRQGRREGASTAESLGEADLRHVTSPEELSRVHELADRLARRMRHRLSRRERIRRLGRRLDLRRTIHRSIGRGGLPIDLAWRKRRDKPLRLVVILDASGSMSQYSAFFVRFIHGVLDRFREAEAFVFHTRLIHVSPALKERNAARAVERLSLIAQGWSGGTKIGESLAAFNRGYAERVVHGRSVVMIVSDGYDTGAPDLLGREMAALRRRTRRIVWLNPMIGWQGYEPTAGGMRAALPYIDLFAPAHNLKSLEALAPYLERV